MISLDQWEVASSIDGVVCRSRCDIAMAYCKFTMCLRLVLVYNLPFSVYLRTVSDTIEHKIYTFSTTDTGT